MDCEKFESTLLDELYDELDEVTSAAAKRHVGGCARCASLLSGLKATRRVAVLPLVDPPADLEDRILAAAREAQKVVPIGRRASRVISWAGSWAMRPQTGMAAVFLLMTGLSALLLRGKHAAPPATMTVSEQGEPVASVQTTTLERPPGDTIDLKAVPPPALAVAPPQAQPVPAATASAAGESALDGLLARGRAAAPSRAAPKPAEPMKAPGLFADSDDSQNASPLAGAPAARSTSVYAPGAAGGGAAVAAAAPPAAPPSYAGGSQGLDKAAGPTGQAQAQSNSGFGAAMSAYTAGDYATATTLFDALASPGDLTSALWAARSVRKGSGCGAAVARYDQVARAGAGTTAGYDAVFEGGQCYKQMGQWDVAQTRFRSLITVPSYVDRAKTELAQMAPKAAAKSQMQMKPQQQAPATQQASPPAATANKAPANVAY
jgi:hypothetical protein